MMKHVLPRLVTFDVTGTLLMTQVGKHYVEIGRQHGLQIDPRRLEQSFRSNYAHLAAEHPLYGRHTGLGWENWWRIIVCKVFKDQHPSVSKDTLDRVADNLISCYATAQCWHVCPGTVKLLDFLRKQNIVLGVISNFDQQLESILKDIRIREYFAFILTSYNFGMEKPNLAIFNEAIRLTKCLRKEKILPSEAMHIGDGIDNDYFGAKDAGWSAFLIRHNENKINEDKIPREHVFESLTELQQHFEKLYRRNYVESY